MNAHRRIFQVHCPSCSTEFPIDSAKLPPQGVAAICSVCLRVFPVHHPPEEVAHLPLLPESSDSDSALDALRTGIDLPEPETTLEPEVEDELEGREEEIPSGLIDPEEYGEVSPAETAETAEAESVQEGEAGVPEFEGVEKEAETPQAGIVGEEVAAVPEAEIVAEEEMVATSEIAEAEEVEVLEVEAIEDPSSESVSATDEDASNWDKDREPTLEAESDQLASTAESEVSPPLIEERPEPEENLAALEETAEEPTVEPESSFDPYLVDRVETLEEPGEREGGEEVDPLVEVGEAPDAGVDPVVMPKFDESAEGESGGAQEELETAATEDEPEAESLGSEEVLGDLESPVIEEDESPVDLPEAPASEPEPELESPRIVEPDPVQPIPVEPSKAKPVFEDLSTFTNEVLAEVESEVPTPEVESSKPAPPKMERFGRRDPHERARHLARVLVSDIIAYYPVRYQESLARRTLPEDFADEIQKSYREYVDQVGIEMAESTPYFVEALNHVLGRGEKFF